MTRNAPIKSPCILVCALDLASSHCKGCGRSREQIALWTRYSDAQREEIMQRLPAVLDSMEE